MKNKITILAIWLVPFIAFSQGTYVPLDQDVYGMIDRYEIKKGSFADKFHSSYKPYTRQSVLDLVNNWEDSASLSRTDKFNFEYLKIDNWQFDSSEIANSEKPILKWFYYKKPDWYSVNTKDFKLRVNPVIYFQGGKDNTFGENLYLNTRGLVVEGMIDDKVGFYTFMTDNQMVSPNYVQEYRSKYHLPQQGFVKGLGTPNGTDYFNARGYVTFKITKHIDTQFGHDRHIIGNGYRSLILSDNAPNYLFLKFNTQIWKIKYTNLFAEMNAENRVTGDKVLEKKYMAFHHLSWNASKNLNFGVWEATMFGRNGRYFELQYLNPIIFYRSVEQQIGSGDNALLGADWKWNFKKHFSFYGQVVLDEMKIGELRAGNGWWGNKQALQMGLKYIDAFGIQNLDLHVERNNVRPFTYAYKDLYRNYSHNLLPLAHPLGANFTEWIIGGRYQPIPRLDLQARMFLADFGLDTDSNNYGNNINRDYGSDRPEYGHKTGQGVGVNLRKIDFTASYMLKHNIFLDLSVTKRQEFYDINTALNKDATIVMGALRWNMNRLRHDF